MKLLILGATGGTGRELVKQAIEAGHPVTVLARDPSKVSGAKIVERGDATDAETIARILPGHDAVVSSLGHGMKLKGDVVSRATEVLIPAMTQAGVRRIIVVSAFGVGDTYRQANLPQKLLFRTFLRVLYADKKKADDMLRASDLDWTIVHPVQLTNGPRTGTCRAGEELPMRGMPKISRADIAEFIVSQLTRDTWVRRNAVLSY